MSRDSLLVFSKRCAVTMYELLIQLSRDGRTRGLWVFFRDDSKDRIDSNIHFFEQAFERFAAHLVEQKMLKADDKKQAFELHMALRLHFDRWFRSSYEPQGALMEWPEALKFHEAMGREIKKARTRGDLPKERK